MESPWQVCAYCEERAAVKGSTNWVLHLPVKAFLSVSAMILPAMVVPFGGFSSDLCDRCGERLNRFGLKLWMMFVAVIVAVAFTIWAV